ncbi:MAG: DNA-binding protein WhiA [Lachnospiraceae bacterium]|nr:DNA-binding protein WhiA [Lachnospiraceae bacterium]
MSFSMGVKEEVLKQMSTARHCKIAELAGIISYQGQVAIYGCGNDKRYRLCIHTENIMIASRACALIKKTFKVTTQVMVRSNPLNNSRLYVIDIKDFEDSKSILMAVKLIKPDGQVNDNLLVDEVIMQSPCCKRAFIRGAFLVGGSVTDPHKAYHFEINTQTENKASQLIALFKTFGVNAKKVVRKGNYIVYIKEGNQISDVLNICGAHVAMMELENVRIVKDMRNSINRQVNCEAANIGKTVSAATKQLEDIKLIKNTIGLESLKDNLREVALLRLENDDMPLKDLGLLLDPPLGKSGVNHRLRKLSEIADNIREDSKEDF